MLNKENGHQTDFKIIIFYCFEDVFLFVLVVFWKTLKNFFKNQSKKLRLDCLFAAFLRVVRKDF